MFMEKSESRGSGLTLNSSLCFALCRNRASEMKFKPNVQEGQTAIEVIQKMEWYAGDGKKKPTLAKKESVQVSIQDNHAGKGGS